MVFLFRVTPIEMFVYLFPVISTPFGLITIYAMLYVTVGHDPDGINKLSLSYPKYSEKNKVRTLLILGLTFGTF